MQIVIVPALSATTSFMSCKNSLRTTVNVVSPHVPHVASREYWDLYADAEDFPEFGIEQATAQHPYAQDLRSHFETEQFTGEQVRGLRHTPSRDRAG